MFCRYEDDTLEFLASTFFSLALGLAVSIYVVPAADRCYRRFCHGGGCSVPHPLQAPNTDHSRRGLTRLR